MHSRLRYLIVAVVIPFAFSACGDDDDDDDDTAASVEVPVAATTPSAGKPATTPTVGPGTVTVVATDYKYDGLPPTAPVGTSFALQNDSTAEVHEMVIIRIPDNVTEPIGQILALTEEEQQALVGDVEPTMVIVALPGEAGVLAEGNVRLDEPGRYAVLCFIPEGADPALVEQAMSDPEATGPPDLGTGMPHAMKGMYAEILINA